MSEIEVSVTETTIDVNITAGPTIAVTTTTPPAITVETTVAPAISVAVVQGGGGSGLPVGPAGGDLDGNYPNPTVVAIHEFDGARLPFGTILDGQTLVRSGTSIIGIVPAPGGVTSVSGAGAISVTPGSTPVVSVAEDAAAATTSTRKLGVGATDACAGNDSRLSNARTPTSHASTHATGAADAIAQIAKLGTGGTYLSTLQTVSAATATISADVDLVEVTYSAAACTLTLPTQANAPIGTVIQVSKANTGAFKITVTPDSGSSINGGATNASVDIPSSTVASSASTADVVAQLRRIDATNWRMA